MTENSLSWNFANQLVQDDLIASLRSHAALASLRSIPNYVAEALRSDVRPYERILHPMCNFGVEALTLSHMLQTTVVGVDFSEVAVDTANLLAGRLDLPCHFYCSEIHEFARSNSTRFDALFVSLGSLWWLPNISGFINSIARSLSSGAKVLVWDFHPIVHCVDDEQKFFRDYPLRSAEMVHPSGVTNYQAEKYGFSYNRPWRNPHAVTDHKHRLDDVIGAFLNNSFFTLSSFRELHDTGNEKYFDWQEQGPDGYWRAKMGYLDIPLAFLLEADRR